jgi:hypothetical protein
MEDLHLAMKLNPIQAAIYTLVVYYIQRQQTVRMVFEDLRPEWLEFEEALSRGAHDDAVMSIAIRMKQNITSPLGRWGTHQEWRYQFRGKGCLLTHYHTREPIQWEIPNIYRFDRRWLTDHMYWLFGQSNGYNAAALFKSRISSINGDLGGFVDIVLSELIHMGKLSRDDVEHQFQYALLK